MKKVVGIYCGNSQEKWDSDVIKEKGIGGSESWAIYLSNELAKAGFHVIIFGNPEKYFFNEYGVEYVPFQFFERRLEYQHFDYFIASRRVDCITSKLSSDKNYLMCHDLNILFLSSPEELLLKAGRLDKLIVLSNFQQSVFNDTYQIFNNLNTHISFNGVDKDLYNYDLPKKNQMVWSSCFDRGLDFFAEYVLPLIREKVPDFVVLAPNYDTVNQQISKKYDGIVPLGNLSKQELAKIQCESKIFIYPPTFMETFCITAVENAFAKNALILTDVGALADTLKGYKCIIGNNYASFDLENQSININLQNYKITAQYIADLAVELLTNEEKRQEYANQAYEICKKYTWDNVAKDWINLWFGDIIKYMGN